MEQIDAVRLPHAGATRIRQSNLGVAVSPGW